MKRCIALTLSIHLIMVSSACGHLSESPSVTESTSVFPQTESALSQNTGDLPVESEPGEVDKDMTTITITIGSSVFSARLYDNDAARVLLEQLPMTLDMSEMNGNEKYYYMPNKFPIDSQQIGNINTGDLMLYGSDCLVLFYKSFSTSYSYTKLGYVEDVTGLAAALGSSGVEATFAVSK